MSSVKSYLVITAAYWSFTLTDGALRMLVILFFHAAGYGALDIAFLFLFYEFFGIVTNLVGGWIGTRFGLNKTLFSGLVLQIVALYLLSFESWHSIAYVMMIQALSGIAKDLNKMSAKSSLKLIVNESANNQLFRWVALLTGSKNALKGIGFFVGGLLMTVFGFSQALIILSVSLALVMVGCLIFSPANLQAPQPKVKFRQLLSKSPAINKLSGARLFLFGARDIWFVVALPVYLQSQLDWSHTQVGSLLAIWVIVYGFVQSAAPNLLGLFQLLQRALWQTRFYASLGLLCIPLLMLLAHLSELSPLLSVVVGLLGFAAVFAINSAVHSYLILAYSTRNDVALDVGFYYMANAAGRLLGTLLSGLIYQWYGFTACIIGSSIMIALCSIISATLDESRPLTTAR